MTIYIVVHGDNRFVYAFDNAHGAKSFAESLNEAREAEDKTYRVIEHNVYINKGADPYAK